MAKPLIGITGRRWPATKLGVNIAAAMTDLTFDLHFSDYSKSVALAGGLPVELSRDAEVGEIVQHLDGLVLSGGADIEPNRYGADEHPDLGDTEPERDEWELALLAAARAKGLPILAICRGMQLVNVAFGGTLHQHVTVDEGAGHPKWDDDGRSPAHGVHVTQGTMTSSVLEKDLAVNSLHHQIVDRVGEGLIVSATASDGVVEGLETPDGNILGVQWHPELLAAPDPTFSWLIQKAREASNLSR